MRPRKEKQKPAMTERGGKGDVTESSCSQVLSVSCAAPLTVFLHFTMEEKLNRDSKDTSSRLCVKLVAGSSLEQNPLLPSTPCAWGPEGRNRPRAEKGEEGRTLCFWLCPRLSPQC